MAALPRPARWAASLLLLPLTLLCLAASADAQDAAPLPLQVAWINGRIVVGILPLPNEGYIQIANRVLEHPERFAEIGAFNQNRPVMTGRTVKFPLVSLQPALRGAALRALYPEDELTEEGWAHTVTDPLESLLQLTESFTGSKRYFKELAKRNRLKNPDVLPLGTQILIPLEWIPDEMGMRPPGLKEPLRLVKDEKSGRFYAVYALERDDTLYSLVLRFTDREQAAEVNRLSRLLLKLNALRDAKQIRAGRTIRIPLEWLSEEWVRQGPKPPPLAALEPPPGRAAPPAKEAPKRRPRPLPGAAPARLHVILDPGHGGADPGAVYGSRRSGDLVYEHKVVYDIALRARQLLEAGGHRVYMTVRNPAQSAPQEQLSMREIGKEEVLVTPPYRMISVTTAVNLRVYLVDSIYRRLTEKEGVAPENVVLVSLHGDALAPTLRGTMIYIPDHRLRTPEFGPRGKAYRARQEFTARMIRYAPAENRAAQERSNALAQTIIRSLDSGGVRVNRRKAVRPFYYRDGVRTLPAVLRYSRVPQSVLVEIANLNNPDDRREMLRGEARQRVAKGLAAALDAHGAQQKALAKREE
jgi:N-acetylmuramoyl-L-alanine amidase